MSMEPAPPPDPAPPVEQPPPVTAEEMFGRYPRMSQAVGLVVVGVVVLLFVHVVITVILGLTFRGNVPPEVNLMGMAAGNTIAIGLVILWSFLGTGLGMKDAFPLKPFDPGLLLPLVICMMGVALVSSELDNLLRFVMPVPEFVMEMMGEIMGAGGYSLVLLVVAAPVTEEPLFRGVILGGLATHYSRTRAIIYSSILFSLFHLNPYQFVPAFLMGLVFGWLMLETGSLWLCLVAHALANGFCFSASLLPEGSIPGFTYNPPGMGEHAFQPFWLDAAGIAALALGVYALRRRFARR